MTDEQIAEATTFTPTLEDYERARLVNMFVANEIDNAAVAFETSFTGSESVRRAKDVLEAAMHVAHERQLRREAASA